MTPDHPTYDAARQVYNAMIDRRPAAIAYCADVADVMRAVNFAREHEMLVAIRSGGHNAAGLGVCDDGLVIDLSPLDGIRVDPVARTVRVEGGATVGAVDHATHAFGLATASGVISTTGVGGITLGGGLGHLTRQYGLAIDNLLEADVVLADGSFVTTNEQQHADLFWALRGGGGNFGVVTSFLFRLHPVETVYAGPMLWRLDQAAEVMRWYREFLPNVPDQLSGFFAILQVPPGPPFPEHLWNETMCGVVWCYGGPLSDAESVFGPIRRQFGGPALDFVGPLPHPALQSMFDALYPPGLLWYWKADFFNEITDEAIERHLEFAQHLPTGLSTMHLYPIDGVAGRVSADATAWAYRDATWAAVIIGVSPDPDDKERITSWARAYWDAVHPSSAGGGYINFMMDEGNDAVRATYKEQYQRLQAIKTRYDPTNLFRVNQNIPPLNQAAD
jgi:FAD/FMN-containing dehydrogenase